MCTGVSLSRGRELQGEQLSIAGKAWPWKVMGQTSMNSGRIKLAKSSTETKKLGLTLLRTMKEANKVNMLYSLPVAHDKYIY